MTGPPGYRLKHERVRGCGADLEICSLLDRFQYWDPDLEAEHAGVAEASWSFFGVVWPSSRVLALSMQTLELNGQRILEIGCGLGVPSLVLHRRAGDVTASDCHPLAASFLERNLALNHLAAMPYRTVHWGRTDALGRFDLIIGSDVLYEPEHSEQLSQFLHLHAEADGTVMLVDPNRSQRAAFCRKMEDHGFRVESRAVHESPDVDEAYHGRLLTCSRG